MREWMEGRDEDVSTSATMSQSVRAKKVPPLVDVNAGTNPAVDVHDRMQWRMESVSRYLLFMRVR